MVPLAPLQHKFGSASCALAPPFRLASLLLPDQPTPKQEAGKLRDLSRLDRQARRFRKSPHSNRPVPVRHWSACHVAENALAAAAPPNAPINLRRFMPVAFCPSGFLSIIVPFRKGKGIIYRRSPRVKEKIITA